MRVIFHVTAGPTAGHALVFTAAGTLVVGRPAGADARAAPADPYQSRAHFRLNVSPPLCRLTDLGSRNGTFVNGERVAAADLAAGDLVRAGRTEFRVAVATGDDPDETLTDAPAADAGHAATGSFTPAAPPLDDGTQISRLPNAAAPDAGNPTPVVPGYAVVREIGRGAMGAVYEAVREADGQTVALKVIRPGVVPTRQQAERFLREAVILRTLDHPGVVRFFDSGEERGLLWFAMEYVPGTDAARKVKADGPLPVYQAVRVAVNVLRGLGHAHARGFVHRDVKPSNVLLYRRESGKAGVKLADFGLARVYQASQLSGLTLAGDVGGTPAFMAPEQVTDFRNVGPPADVYSTAATLYYLLTGAYVLDMPGDNESRFAMILGGEPTPVQSRRADIPDTLAAMVHAALAKTPAHRPPSAEAFADALTPFTK